MEKLDYSSALKSLVRKVDLLLQVIYKDFNDYKISNN
jgi:hypothetical protein